ncbi:MAG: hypothetical protein HYW79_01985 [Parcubacteria group bacterium]|nr:hypothetical protein [Parcubacteria group bacterium]
MVNIPSTMSSGTFGAFKPPASSNKSYLSYLIGLFAILVLGAGAYFFFYKGVGLSLKTPIISPAPVLNPLELKVGELPGFRFDVFDGDFYKSLKIYGGLPIIADSLGRVNPFVPY